MQRPSFRSLAFVLLGLALAGIVGVGVFVLRALHERDLGGIQRIANLLPASDERKEDIGALLAIGEYFLQNDGRERTILLLFQNNWELRPGGGFIGSYGILKLKNGAISSLTIDDSYQFDQKIPPVVPPPYPYQETVKITALKLRDSNTSPDFPTNAALAEYFYHLGGGTEQLDGVIGITTNVLTRLLAVSGPITLHNYPGTYSDENAIYTLEHQVEISYRDQGIPWAERKSVLNDLAGAVLEKIQPHGAGRIMALADILLVSLKEKDIQLSFKDANLQRTAQTRDWAGAVDQTWNGDYLGIVDANLGGWKSDYVVRRSVAYTADYSKATPVATLTITYRHPAEKRDWLINHYQTYLRVYVPKGSRSVQSDQFTVATMGEEFGKQFFGALVMVPIGEEKTVRITYELPPVPAGTPYHLKIQRQAGAHAVPFSTTYIDVQGQTQQKEIMLSSDTIVR